MTQSKPHYINGTWHLGSGETIRSINPANGDVVWQGASAASAEVEHAVDAAHRAFDDWSLSDLEERKQILKRFQEEVQTDRERLAIAICQETGKTFWEAKGEVNAIIGKIPVSLEAHQERCGEKRQTISESTCITRHRPHGVLAIFGPYNFPAHLPNGHIVPALIAGNTIVFKPSEFTPHSAELMVQCWERAGLPKGVLNLVQGAKATGSLLANHPRIHGLLFTGSAQTGLLFSQLFAQHPEKILALECGGNNPLVVWEAADQEATSLLITVSAFSTSGQRCTCARRLILPMDEEISLPIIQRCIQLAKNLRIGSYSDDPEPFMGPVISEKVADHILAQQEGLAQKGGKWLLKPQKLKSGTGFITPGIMDTTYIPQRPDEEIFGPFLQIIRVPDFEAAIKEANNTRFGLSAGIITDKESRWNEFRQRIRAGIVNWNTPLVGASSKAPFGGIGLSGNHRPSAFYASDYCSYPTASMEAAKAHISPSAYPGMVV